MIMDHLKLSFLQLRKLALLLLLSMLPLTAMANVHGFYEQQNLVSDGFTTADHTDKNLVNPWGLAFGTTTPVWVANEGSGTSTIYDGNGNSLPLVVTVPPAPKIGKGGKPTGIIFNGTPGWVVSSNGKSGPASFIFVTDDGTISGWARSVDSAKAIIAVDNSTKNAVYKGLTQGANGTMTLLYVTNFWAGTVEAYDNQFHPVTLPGGFADPGLPAGFAPFGIQNIGGDIYVTYAKQDATRHDSVKGEGLGLINVFDANGNFLYRFATGGTLNAPWAVALAPSSFGKFANHLLIGNFGDGKINAFNPVTKTFQGQLLASDGFPLSIDGLWGLSFGNGLFNQPTNALFFTAGPVDESHGIYGAIRAIRCLEK